MDTPSTTRSLRSNALAKMLKNPGYAIVSTTTTLSDCVPQKHCYSVFFLMARSELRVNALYMKSYCQVSEVLVSLSASDLFLQICI